MEIVIRKQHFMYSFCSLPATVRPGHPVESRSRLVSLIYYNIITGTRTHRSFMYLYHFVNRVVNEKKIIFLLFSTLKALTD